MDTEKKEGGEVIRLGTASAKRSPTSKPVTAPPKPAGKTAAAKACQTILSCYPDYGKAPPEYLVNIIDLLSTYPEKTLVAFCDLRTGVASQCPYLPTIADIVRASDAIEMAENLEAHRKDQEYRELADKEAFEAWMITRREKYKSVLIYHPTAQLGPKGEIFYFKSLETQGQMPSPVQIEIMARVNRYRPPYPWQTSNSPAVTK